MSDWNLYLERKLSLRLGLEASRLVDAIARETLGFNTRSRGVGQRLLRERAGMHGKSFDRARQELVDVGLVGLTRGKGGRGNRDVYELLLDEQSPADERAIGEQTPAETPAETPAPERGRKEEGGREDLDQDHCCDGDAEAPPRQRRKVTSRDLDSLQVLVDSIDNADDNTFLTLWRNYRDLDHRYFDHALDVLLKNDPDDPARYVYGILRRLAVYGDPDHDLPAAA